MPSERFAEPRARGRALVLEHLGLDEPTVPALLAVADDVLGTERVARCVELIQAMRFTQRYQGLAALASLVVGTRELGAEWWTLPHRDPVTRLHRDGPITPDERLVEVPPPAEPSWHSAILDLGHWISDDAAVAAWGPLVDEVDLNDPNAIDRIQNLPPDAEVGKRVTAHFDVGGVVDAVVEERDGGVLGTRLVGKSRYSTPADVNWGWGVALAAPGPFPLPGDPESVYGAAVDPERAEKLRAEALAFGWAADDVGGPWITRGDVCAALARLDWPWLEGDGDAQQWAKATEELIDWP
jgi:hypothetical protein